jgi:hypothetical protein
MWKTIALLASLPVLTTAALAGPLSEKQLSSTVARLRRTQVRAFKRAFSQIARGEQPRDYVLVEPEAPFTGERLFKKGTEHDPEASFAVRQHDGSVSVVTYSKRLEPGKATPTTVKVGFAPGLSLKGRQGFDELEISESRTTSNGAQPDSRRTLRFYQGGRWKTSYVNEHDAQGKRAGLTTPKNTVTSYDRGSRPWVFDGIKE